MLRFKDHAICIRHIDWSETSQIVALLTKRHGIVRAVAKGSKRTSPSSVQRFSGGIELLTLGQAVGVIKPSAELATLTEWDLEEPHWHLHRDLTAQRLAMHAADLAGALLAEQDAHPPVFMAMCDMLHGLADPKTRQVALLSFQWQLLDDCGYRPELDRDVRTGRMLTQRRPFIFDVQAGGLTMESTTTNRTWKVRTETVETLRLLSQSGDHAVLLSDIPPQTLKRTSRLLCFYTRAILDRQLPTMSYLLSDTDC